MSETTVCDHCKGRGKIISEDGMSSRHCLCTRRAYLADALTKVLGPLDNVEKLPKQQGRLTGMIDRKLLIRASWSQFRAHARVALIIAMGDDHGEFPFVTCTSDLALKEDYFKRDNRPKPRRDEDPDKGLLMLDTPKLLIIRTGVFKLEKGPTSALIHQALESRVMANPKGGTWVLVDSSQPWGKGHPSWSQQLAEYLDDNYTTVDLTPKPDTSFLEEP